MRYTETPHARVDIIDVKDMGTVLCVNAQTIQSAQRADVDKRREIHQLAERLQDQGLPLKQSDVVYLKRGSLSDAVAQYFANEERLPEAGNHEELALDRQINTDMLDSLSSGLKGALTRSLNRISSLKDEVFGKYLASGIATSAGALATSGALNDNPILMDHLPAIATSTAAVGAMTLYGITALTATRAHQALINASVRYQDLTNEKLLSKLDTLVNEQGVDSVDKLTPKDKAGFLQSLRLSYPDADADVVETFAALYDLRNSPEINRQAALENDTEYKDNARRQMR